MTRPALDVPAPPGPMSPRRRFLTALLGGRPDRVPVGNVVSVVTLDLMRLTGAGFPDAHLDPVLMARLAAAGHEILGYDTVMPVFSVVQESAAFGCPIHWGRPDMMPAAEAHPWADATDFEIPPGWMDTKPIQAVLDAITLLRRRLGHHVAIVGKVMGPWSLAYHLMGVENFLISTIEDPDRARRCLETLAPVPVLFAHAQVQAGADVICLADHATGGMVSPQSYHDLLFPLHRRIMPAIGAPVVLHCCGNTTDRVHLFAHTGIDCYHFESLVDLPTALAAARGRIRLMGNINNPKTLMAGTPAHVLDACRAALAAGVDILSPECAVPLSTPTPNLQALVQAAQAAPRH